MKNLLKVSVFAMATVLSSGAMAATGTGEAQAELATSLSVENDRNANFGTIAIDPAAGEQVVTMILSGITCPAAYSCSGTVTNGRIKLIGSGLAWAEMSMEGSTAILSDGAGNTVIFDPVIWSNGLDSKSIIPIPGGHYETIIGTLTFDGDEPAGTYNTTNAGGSGYQITLNY